MVVPQSQNAGDWAANDFTLWLEERTGVHIEWQEVAGTADERRAVVNAMIAGGDLPDIFMSQGFNASQLELYGSQGLFVPLNDLIEQNGVEIKRIFTEYPATQELISSNDGTIYSMPSDTVARASPRLVAGVQAVCAALDDARRRLAVHEPASGSAPGGGQRAR